MSKLVRTTSGEIVIVAPGTAPAATAVTAPYAPTPVLELLRAAADLLGNTSAPALVREIEQDFPRSLGRRPAQLVKAADARPSDLTGLVRAAGFADLEALRAQAAHETGTARPRGARPVGVRPVGARTPGRTTVDDVIRRETAAVSDTLGSMASSGALELAAGEILRSRRRWVFGDMHSRAFAHLFAADLALSLGQVTLIEPTASGVLAAIGDVQRRDSLTIFTFAPYSRLAARLVRHFDEHEASVVTITDGTGPALDSAHVLRVQSASGTASPAAAVALAATLAELATAGAKGAHRRVAKQRAVADELQWYDTTSGPGEERP